MTVQQIKEKLIEQGRNVTDFLNDDGSEKTKKQLEEMLTQEPVQAFPSSDASRSSNKVGEQKNDIPAGSESEKLQKEGWMVTKIHLKDGVKVHDLSR